MPLYVAIILIALIVAGFVYGAFRLSARADRQSDDEWIAMSRKDFGDAPKLPRAKSIRKAETIHDDRGGARASHRALVNRAGSRLGPSGVDPSRKSHPASIADEGQHDHA